MSQIDKVGILYSPGFGAGWSTWGTSPGMELDQELAHAVEAGDKGKIMEIVERNWPDEYHGGVDQLAVEWVEQGTPYYINEYDGSEEIVFSDDFKVAKL